MSLYYCLAKTEVTGEIIIQGSSVTYSASASALDSSNTSFKEAKQVATINSNAAATVAARKTIDGILAQYAYVLADETITTMINNSLNTTITRITPRYLERIADTVDGIQYILKKNTTIAENQYLLIPNGKQFIIPRKRRFINRGWVQIGQRRGPRTKDSSTDTDTYVWYQDMTESRANNGIINVGTGSGNDTATLTISKDPTVTDVVTFQNYGTVNNYAGGTVSVTSVQFANLQFTQGSIPGSMQNLDLTATFTIQ